MPRLVPEQHDRRALALAPVRRWKAANKLELMRAIEAGLVTVDEARTAHCLSADELAAWWVAFRHGGLAALKRKAARA